MQKESYTTDWFSSHIGSWSKHMAFLKRPREPINAIEIGSFEGRSAKWLCDHILVDQDTLVCVDPWADYPNLPTTSLEGAFERFQSNLAHEISVGKVVPYRMHANDFFLSGGHERTLFQIAYVDGDHNADKCLTDILNCWQRLSLGGILIVDDYRWSKPHVAPLPPKAAIDAFIKIFVERLEILELGSQLIARKIN